MATYIGIMADGRIYGPAAPEMEFESDAAAIEFAQGEGIAHLEKREAGDLIARCDVARAEFESV
jgi:hypothetical protein